MIEIKFQKDTSSEYLIIKKQNDGIHTKYEEGILYNNPMPNLLNFSLREHNSEVFYYMDIHHMRDVKSDMECGVFGKQDIKLLLADLKTVIMQLENYLLGKEILYLGPECIYRDVKNNRFHFICIPGLNEEYEIKIRDFLAWFMKNMDYGNKELVSYIFELYRKNEAGEDIFDEPEEVLEPVVIEEVPETEVHIEEPVCFEDETVEETVEEDINKRMPFQSIVITSACITLIVTMFFAIAGKTMSFWVRSVTGIYLQSWIWPAMFFSAGMLITFIIHAFYPDHEVKINMPKAKKLNVSKLKLFRQPEFKNRLKMIIRGEEM